MNQLELYDRAGRLIRSVAVTQDEQDATKWHLAEAVALGANQIESAVLRFRDGTSHPLEPSLFPTSVRINTLFIAVPTVPEVDDPDEPAVLGGTKEGRGRWRQHGASSVWGAPLRAASSAGSRRGGVRRTLATARAGYMAG